jgi:hypothetical protein
MGARPLPQTISWLIIRTIENRERAALRAGSLPFGIHPSQRFATSCPKGKHTFRCHKFKKDLGELAPKVLREAPFVQLDWTIRPHEGHSPREGASPRRGHRDDELDGTPEGCTRELRRVGLTGN